uniref:MHC class I-like antigen recognition-like domain-containing protein n=1 Tax=Astyanax mexicanus TaxID=7994 RepID=A0A8B9GYV9_ASTMX
MEEKMALMKLLLFLTVTIHLSSAACNRPSHLQFRYTENTDGETAEALLDGEQFVYYEKSNETVIPTTEWMKKIENNDLVHWGRLTNKLKDGLQSARELVGTAVSSSNRNEGDHRVELMYGCKLDKGIESGYWKFGKYFLSLNLKAGAWTAENNESEPIKQKMEKEGNVQKAFLLNQCILWLQKYMDCKSNNKTDVKDPRE